MIKKEDCIVFDYDCREGICGSCSLVINGYPHGMEKLSTTCQIYMRDYKNKKELWIEPFRSKAIPIIKDLIVDRSGFDKIIASGGYISTHTGSAPEANSILVDKTKSEQAFFSATCIGCAACVAVCPNRSATLFVAAKINHLDNLPQGMIESKKRAKKMVLAMDKLNFGLCSNHRHCESVCPKGITTKDIMHMNKILS